MDLKPFHCETNMYPVLCVLLRVNMPADADTEEGKP